MALIQARTTVSHLIPNPNLISRSHPFPQRRGRPADDVTRQVKSMELTVDYTGDFHFRIRIRDFGFGIRVGMSATLPRLKKTGLVR